MFQIFNFIFCLSLISTSLFASTTETYDLIEQTNNNFKEFEHYLNSYFSYLDKSAEEEKNNAYGRLLLKNKEELKQAIRDANMTFLDLRQKFRDIVFLKYSNHPDTNCEAIALEAELTYWYISTIKFILFPSDLHME